MKKISKFQKAMENNKIPYYIGETAYIHEGDPKYIYELVEKLSEKNCCDAIKYHILINVDSYITPFHELYQLYQDFKISENDWIKILEKTKELGFETVVLVDEKYAIDFVEKNIEFVDAIELHAIALNNIEMLKRVKKINIPIILGVGGSVQEDIEFALDYLDRRDILLIHGFQNYPTKFEYINFERMEKIKKKYNLPVGFADHTIWNSVYNETLTLAGFMSGANFIEKHVALKAGEKRCDFESAISIELFSSIYEKMNILNMARGDGSFEISDYENIYAKNGPMKFTIVASKDLKLGDTLSEENITFKRTGEENNIRQRDYLNLLGKKVIKDIPKDKIVNYDNVEK